MAFNSSILMSKTNDTDNHSISSITHSNADSAFYNILEMNDTIHDIDIASKIKFYRTLCSNVVLGESADLEVLNENILEDGWNGLVKIIETIIKLVKEAARRIFNIGALAKSKYKKYVNINPKNFPENSWYGSAGNMGEVKTINVFHYPDISIFSSSGAGASLVWLVSLLEKICDNKENSIEDSELRNSYKTMAGAINRHYGHNFDTSTVTNAKAFSEFAASLCYIETKDMNAPQWHNHFLSLNDKKLMHSNGDYSKIISGIEKHLDNAKSILNHAAFNTEEQYTLAKTVVSYIKELTTACTSLIERISKFENKMFEYHNRIFERYMLCKTGSTNEAGYIHGEQFDSDTLFDNEDYRDFNRTEWLDLNITTECFAIKYELMECSKRIAIQEALIMADDTCYNKFDKLTAMKEAEVAKTENNIKAIIERMKQLLNQFLDKIKARFSDNAKILSANKDIVNKPIKLASIKSAGDIIAGMYRVQNRMNIIPFNYGTMKDDLKDKETFFKNKILPTLNTPSQYNKRTAKWEDGMSIVDYCKVYFGASMPEDKYPKCDLPTAEVEANKSNIVRFLQSSDIFAAKYDMQAFENECRKINSSIQRSSQNTQQQNDNSPDNAQDSTNDNKATNESYYSVLYNAWITEADITMGERPETEQQNGSNNSNNEEANAFRIYMECYKDVILAKMTASEFIVSELMQIMKAHIKYYGGNIDMTKNKEQQNNDKK